MRPTYSTGIAPSHAVDGEVMGPEDGARALFEVWETRGAAAFGYHDGEIEHERTFTALEEQILLGGASVSRSGVPVGVVSALQVSAVFGCGRVIAEDIAKTKRKLKRRVRRDGRVITVDEPEHNLQRLLSGRPNDWMTSFEFWEFMVFWAALAGESYAIIVKDTQGRPSELLPLRYGACRPEVDSTGWRVRYRISGYGESWLAAPGEVLVIRGPMADEARAFEPIRLAREAIGLAVAIESAQGRFHANDLRPSGVLSIEMGATADTLKSRDVIDRIKADWKSAYGPGGDGGIAILDRKFDFKTLAITAADNQTLENRRMQIEEICRFFRVFPQKIMHPSAAGSYGSVEQFNINHVSDTLQAWAERCEQACARDLIDEHDPADAGLYVEFDLFALARGTLGDRMSAYEKMLRLGWTPNEIRREEGWDPLPYPEMDRPQLMANNTGLAPTPLLSGASDTSSASRPDTQSPAADAQSLPPPLPGERPQLPAPDLGAVVPASGLPSARPRLPHP